MFTIHGGHSDITDGTETRRHLSAEEESPIYSRRRAQGFPCPGIEGLHVTLCSVTCQVYQVVILKLFCLLFTLNVLVHI